jgi:hypothetical protein
VTEVDYRERPDLYRVGRGEEGVFRVEPYKSELLPLWRFRTPAEAAASATAIRARYDAYRAAGDLVGMDMARKYLQMGWTRSLRYAKYPGGRKRTSAGEPIEPRTWADPSKRQSAAIFKAALDDVRSDPAYREAVARLRQRDGAAPIGEHPRARNVIPSSPSRSTP